MPIITVRVLGELRVAARRAGPAGRDNQPLQFPRPLNLAQNLEPE
jgi:hypothetical protein